jgi:class 3 adenylate cyclase
MDVVEWLHQLGLEQYAPAFCENRISADLLPSLTAEDLKDLGISLVGDRKRLLQAIATLDPVPGSASAVRGQRDAQRRQLTVMFVDLVGSTALSARLDPEEMGEVLRDYQDTVASEVARFDGHVAKFMGDGVLVYLGFPQAHEDDPERAVRAGLAVVGAVAKLRASDGGSLACRIGIATGLVVVGALVGEGEARERAVVGETPNLAARLQQLAGPGDIVVADGTRRLLGSLFEVADLGPHHLHGLPEPVRAWLVLGEGAAEGRFDALRGEVVSPLIGRVEELALLLDRWRLARSGKGQVVLLGGEPGIGKSRLVLALRERTRDEPRIRLSYACSPYHTNSDLWPVIQQLERAAAFVSGESVEQKLTKLEAVIGRVDLEPTEQASFLAPLLGLSTDGRYPVRELTPQQRKAGTLAALLAQLEGSARQQPVLLILEDAQWLDPTTRELFDLAVERLRHLPVLLVATFRPELAPPWTGSSYTTLVSLDRLAPPEVAALIDRVTGGRILPPEAVDAILTRTGGVPLFVEELTKTLLESGLLREEAGGYTLPGPLPSVAIPATLQDSLMARLDLLAPVKEVAQVAACIGREFPHGLLTCVAGIEEARLAAALETLTEAGLIFRQPTPGEAAYAFKHALIQDVAYQSLLKARRRQLHARIANVLEERFGEVATQRPELLALHFAAGGLPARAIGYWRTAGDLALRRSANAEAVAHVKAAIGLLPELPDNDQRKRLKTNLQLAVGGASIDVNGLASTAVETAYLDSQRLAQEVGDGRSEFTALWGLWRVHFARADMRKTSELTEDLLHLAEREQDPELLLESLHASWGTAWYRGDLVAARQHVERGRLLYDQREHRKLGFTYGGHDPGTCCQLTGSIALWVLGYPDQAREWNRQAYALAEQLGVTHTLVHTWCWATILPQLLDDTGAVQCRARDLHTIATERGLANYLGHADIFLGWVLARDGACAEGVQRMLRGLTLLENAAGGAQYYTPYFRSLLADGYVRAGRRAEALRTVEVRWPKLSVQAKPGTRRSSFDAGATWCSSGDAKTRRSVAFSEPLRWPSRSMRGLGNSARLSRSPGFVPPTPSGGGLSTSSPRSTNGSPKASTRPTSRMPRRCWTSWRDLPPVYRSPTAGEYCLSTIPAGRRARA